MVGFVRMVIYGLPVVLVALLVGSYWTVQNAPREVLKEMTIGSSGEAKILNPLLSTTTADSEVTGSVFEGLLKYDEDLNIVGELAESYEQAQESWVWMESEEAAEGAREALKQEQEKWEEWNLTEVLRDGTAIGLKFTQPGTETSKLLVEQFLHEKRQDLQQVLVTLPEHAKKLKERLAEFSLEKETAGNVVRSHVLSSNHLLCVIAGEREGLEDAIKVYLHEYFPDQKGEIAWQDSVSHLDEPEIRFQLRRGIRWHDRAPFTAGDVEFTIRMILDEGIASPRRADYELISEVEILGPYEILVRYREPYSPALSSWMIGIVPKHILDGKNSQWWAQNFNRQPVGTGPFKFSEWRPNEYVRLTRNPWYWKGEPALDAVVIRTIPDPVSIRLSFETNQIDFWGVDSHAVSSFEKDEKYEVFSSPVPRYDYVGWNLRRPMFQDVRVRRALAHAVDVDSIIKYVMYGHGIRSNGPYAPPAWFWSDEVKIWDYDVEKAKALLTEAGWTPGADGILRNAAGERFQFTLITNQGNEIRKDVATLLQADFKKIGIEMKIGLYEFAVFISEYVNKLDFDAVLLGWSLGLDYDMYQIWHSSQVNPGQLNVVGYENSKVDQLIEQMRTEYDRDEIKKMAHEFQETIYQDQPYLFLSVPQGVTAMHRGAYRVHRPTENEKWIEEEVRVTKAGFAIYRDWFYRPEEGANITK